MVRVYDVLALFLYSDHDLCVQYRSSLAALVYSVIRRNLVLSQLKTLYSVKPHAVQLVAMGSFA